MLKRYKIHPAIGIARLGNSPTEWFDGPEVPDVHFAPAPNGKYRDANNLVRRQAVKFRIYEYTYDDRNRLTDVRQLTDQDATIQWHVHLANLKSFTRDPSTSNRIPVPNDPGLKTIAGEAQTVPVVSQVFGANVLLGTLMTETSAVLRVLGGFGQSASPSGAAPGFGLFWPDWYDDVSDGPVRATIQLQGTGEMPPVEPAWVVIGVPRFAAPVAAIVTMYDVAYDIAVRHLGLTAPTEVSFTRDIYPILHRVVTMQWVDPDVRIRHSYNQAHDFLKPPLFDLLRTPDMTPGSPARRARERVFNALKNPNGGGGSMPQLVGPAPPEAPQADGLTLTHVQHEVFRRWSLGDFVNDWSGDPNQPPAQPPLPSLSPLEQTLALDKTGLWTGVGGTFGPGIEVGRRFGERQTFQQPFRINAQLPPGYLTSTLSVPWQADYSACGTGWWPSGRPNVMTANGTVFQFWARFAAGENMLGSWWKLGFLAPGAPQGERPVFIETERV
jgi:hypothetical protein